MGVKSTTSKKPFIKNDSADIDKAERKEALRKVEKDARKMYEEMDPKDAEVDQMRKDYPSLWLFLFEVPSAVVDELERRIYGSDRILRSRHVRSLVDDNLRQEHVRPDEVDSARGIDPHEVPVEIHHQFNRSR